MSDAGCRQLRKLVCAALVSGGLTVSGCAGDSSETTAEPPMKFVSAGVQRTSGTAQQRTLPHSLIGAVDSRNIRQVRVGPPPSPWRPDAGQEIYGTTWLTIHVRARSAAPFAYGPAT
jgi:hypothetical protein